MDSSSVASSRLATGELLDVERLRNVETLRKMLFLLLRDGGSGVWAEVNIDDGGDCCGWNRSSCD